MKKLPTILEQCFDVVCDTNRVLREEIESDRQQGKMEQDRAQKEEQIYQDMACDPKHWEQATMDLVDNISLLSVWDYLVDKRFIFGMCARHRYDPSSIGNEFITHVAECNQEIIGKMLKKLLQRAIDDEACK